MAAKFLIPGVEPTTPLAEAAPRLLLSKAEPLFALEQKARSGADVDAVHDMRVASRRLREALRLVAPLYPEKPFRSWYRRIRRITRALGPVRDSDVFIDAIAALRSEVGAGGRLAIAWAVGYRQGVRVHELDVLDRELARLDLERMRSEFERFAFEVRADEASDRPFVEFAHAEVAKRAAVVFGAQDAALVESNREEQHALRIDYKRLRYAVEAFAPCYGELFDELHGTLTAFQDALGDLHDVHVFSDMFSARDRIELAARAGVSADEMAEVARVLDGRAHDLFQRFVDLVRTHPPESLLPRLLLPLASAAAARPAPDEKTVAVGDAPREGAGTEAPPFLTASDA